MECFINGSSMSFSTASFRNRKRGGSAGRRVALAGEKPSRWRGSNVHRKPNLWSAYAIAPTTVKGAEDFSDEEDYVKGGGSELLYMQKQLVRAMDKQNKTVDKLSCDFMPSHILQIYLDGWGEANPDKYNCIHVADTHTMDPLKKVLQIDGGW